MAQTVASNGNHDAKPTTEPQKKDSVGSSAAATANGTMKQQQNGTSIMKWVSLVLLTFQTSFQIFIIKWAKGGRKQEYLGSTVVLLTELVKMVVSFGLEAYTTGSVALAYAHVYQHFTQDRLETLKLMVPGLLYTVQNNLMFVSLANLSMAVQQVTYQLKILTTALLSMLLLGRKIGPLRWFSLIMLVAGVSLVQWPSDGGSAVTGAPQQGDPLIGLMAVLSSCFTSAMASVYLEKILKRTEASIWVRNVQLGFFGVVMGLLTAVITDGSLIATDGLLQGFTPRVVCVVFTNACGGLLCAAVIKYADNIARCFSTALSIILTSLLSWMVLQEFLPSLFFIIGTCMVLTATYLYSVGMPSLSSVFKTRGA